MRQRGRLGYAGYAECLKTIARGDGTATWRTVAEVNDINRMTATRLCHALNDLHIIHIAGWAFGVADGRSRIPCYALGDEPDAPHPTGNPRKRGNKRAESSEILAFVSAIEAMQDSPHHGVSLAEATGIYPRAARHLMQALHRAGLAYIAEWDDRGTAGHGAPMYAFGMGRKDVKKPAPITEAALNRKWSDLKMKRAADAKLMRGLVLGFNGDKRTATYKQRQEVAEVA